MFFWNILRVLIGKIPVPSHLGVKLLATPALDDTQSKLSVIKGHKNHS